MVTEDFDKNKIKTIFIALTLEVLLVLCIGRANLLLKPIYYFFFYNILYGLLFSFLIPLFLLRKEENVFDFLGIKSLGKKQIFILVVFIAFSVGGQIIPIVAKGEIIPWNLVPMGIVPLIMTTFFEEFLFRGFFQNMFEKEFDAITAILVSGLMFSFYHVGYPGFRTFEDILLLFAVGIGFISQNDNVFNNGKHRYIVRNCRGIYCPCESEYKRKVKTTLIDEWKLIPII